MPPNNVHTPFVAIINNFEMVKTAPKTVINGILICFVVQMWKKPYYLA